jgi:hypothetical protein
MHEENERYVKQTKRHARLKQLPCIEAFVTAFDTSNKCVSDVDRLVAEYNACLVKHNAHVGPGFHR